MVNTLVYKINIVHEMYYLTFSNCHCLYVAEVMSIVLACIVPIGIATETSREWTVFRNHSQLPHEAECCGESTWWSTSEVGLPSGNSPTIGGNVCLQGTCSVWNSPPGILKLPWFRHVINYTLFHPPNLLSPPPNIANIRYFWINTGYSR